MTTNIVPCTGNCGVITHDAGSQAHKICQQRTQAQQAHTTNTGRSTPQSDFATTARIDDDDLDYVLRTHFNKQAIIDSHTYPHTTKNASPIHKELPMLTGVVVEGIVYDYVEGNNVTLESLGDGSAMTDSVELYEDAAEFMDRHLDHAPDYVYPSTSPISDLTEISVQEDHPVTADDLRRTMENGIYNKMSENEYNITAQNAEDLKNIIKDTRSYLSELNQNDNSDPVELYNLREIALIAAATDTQYTADLSDPDNVEEELIFNYAENIRKTLSTVSQRDLYRAYVDTGAVHEGDEIGSTDVSVKLLTMMKARRDVEEVLKASVRDIVRGVHTARGSR